MKYFSFGIDRPSPAKVTGRVIGASLVDDIDRVDGSIEAFAESGTQSGEHPAKTQSNVMHFFER